MIQLDGYLYIHISGQRQTGLEKNYGARDARAVCVFRSF